MLTGLSFDWSSSSLSPAPLVAAPLVWGSSVDAMVRNVDKELKRKLRGARLSYKNLEKEETRNISVKKPF